MLDKCKKFTAEFLGTFLLCYIGCGAAVLNSSTPLWSNKWSTLKSFSISYNAHDRKNDNF